MAFFGGIVKQATMKYPMAYFKAWASTTNPKRGDFIALSTTYVDKGLSKPVLAVCWKDKIPLHFISSFGTTVQGAGFDRPRTTKVMDENGNSNDKHFKKHVDCPQLLNEIYHGFGAVDIGDHYRQGILMLEEVWKTHMAWHRSFSTLLGCEVCDAYFLYLLDYIRLNGNRDGAVEFMSWIAQLARLLLKSKDEPESRRNLRPREATCTVGEPEPLQKVF